MISRHLGFAVLALAGLLWEPLVRPTVAAGPNPQIVQITVNSVSAKSGATIDLTARLDKVNGLPIGSQALRFKVDATDLGIRWTDRAGIASARFTLPAKMSVGAHTITAIFDGNGLYRANSAVGTLTVLPTNPPPAAPPGPPAPPSPPRPSPGPNPAVTVIAAPVATAKRGSSVNLTAILSQAGGRPIGAQPLRFKVGATDLGIRWTDQSGKATVVYKIPSNMAKGRHAVTVTYDGNGLYRPSSGPGTLTVQ